METLTKCLQSLKVSTSDNERLAAMMIISKLFDKIEIENETNTQLFNAISPTFLVRLLKPNPSAPSKNSFRSLAVSILCYFGKTNPGLLMEDTEKHNALITQLLDMFNVSNMAENMSLCQDVADLLTAMVAVENGAQCLLRNDVYTKLGEVVITEPFMEKILSLFSRLIVLQQEQQQQQQLSQHKQKQQPQQQANSLGEDFIKFMTSFCRSFRTNQELEKFKYLRIVTRLLQILLEANITVDYQNTKLKSALKSCVVASKDMLQSHLKADVKRSVLCLLCTMVRLCGVEWMFDYKFVEAADSFVLLVLVNITIEMSFLLQSSPTESQEESQAIESGLFITEQVLLHICSPRFEDTSLASDGEFVYKVFCSFKNIMRTVYGFFSVAEEDTDSEVKLSCKHPVVVSAISMLSTWATEETENLRTELDRSLPILRKLAHEDLENIVDRGEDAAVLDTMASFIAQTLPDKELRKTLVSCEYHTIYVRYLSHLLTATENLKSKTRPFEQLIHLLHQFIILEPKLCMGDTHFQEVCTKLVHFVPHIDDTIQLSPYSRTEVIIVSLRLLAMFRTEYNSTVEELIRTSIRFVYEGCDQAMDEELLEVWFIAMQSIIACCQMYREHVFKLGTVGVDMKAWRSKGKLTKDMRSIVEQLGTTLS